MAHKEREAAILAYLYDRKEASVAELTAMGVTGFDVFAYKIPTKKV